MMLQLVPERGFSRLNTFMCTRKFCNKALLVLGVAGTRPKCCHDVATLGTGSKTASTWSNTQRGLFLDRLRLNGLIRAEGRIGMKLVRRGVEFKLNHAKDIRFSKFSESLIVLSCLILSLVVFCHAFVKSSYHIMPCHFMYCKKGSSIFLFSDNPRTLVHHLRLNESKNEHDSDMSPNCSEEQFAFLEDLPQKVGNDPKCVWRGQSKRRNLCKIWKHFRKTVELFKV